MLTYSCRELELSVSVNHRLSLLSAAYHEFCVFNKNTFSPAVLTIRSAQFQSALLISRRITVKLALESITIG
jgi:hypothetical protein